MPTSADLSAQRAKSAYDALGEAETFVEARAAWEDFLTHWRRGLNRCDAIGKRRRGRAYAPCHDRVASSPPLAYLWAARNAEEHGVAEIAIPQDSAIAIGAFGGYHEEEGEPGPNGERTFTYTPLAADPPPFFAIIPEHLKLQPIVERDRVVAVPAGYDYDLGITLAPAALAKFGLEFLLAEAAAIDGSTADSGSGAGRLAR